MRVLVKTSKTSQGAVPRGKRVAAALGVCTGSRNVPEAQRHGGFARGLGCPGGEDGNVGEAHH